MLDHRFVNKCYQPTKAAIQDAVRSVRQVAEISGFASSMQQTIGLAVRDAMMDAVAGHHGVSHAASKMVRLEIWEDWASGLIIQIHGDGLTGAELHLPKPRR